MRVPIVQEFMDERLEAALASDARIDLYRAVVPAQTIRLVSTQFALDDLWQFFAHAMMR